MPVVVLNVFLFKTSRAFIHEEAAVGSVSVTLLFEMVIVAAESHDDVPPTISFAPEFDGPPSESELFVMVAENTLVPLLGNDIPAMRGFVAVMSSIARTVPAVLNIQ